MLAPCVSKKHCEDLGKDFDLFEFTIGKAAVIADCNTREVVEYDQVLANIGDPPSHPRASTRAFRRPRRQALDMSPPTQKKNKRESQG